MLMATDYDILDPLPLQEAVGSEWVKNVSGNAEEEREPKSGCNEARQQRAAPVDYQVQMHVHLFFGSLLGKPADVLAPTTRALICDHALLSALQQYGHSRHPTCRDAHVCEADQHL